MFSDWRRFTALQLDAYCVSSSVAELDFVKVEWDRTDPIVSLHSALCTECLHNVAGFVFDLTLKHEITGTASPDTCEDRKRHPNGQLLKRQIGGIQADYYVLPSVLGPDVISDQNIALRYVQLSDYSPEPARYF